MMAADVAQEGTEYSMEMFARNPRCRRLLAMRQDALRLLREKRKPHDALFNIDLALIQSYVDTTVDVLCHMIMDNEALESRLASQERAMSRQIEINGKATEILEKLVFLLDNLKGSGYTDVDN